MAAIEGFNIEAYDNEPFCVIFGALGIFDQMYTMSTSKPTSIPISSFFFLLISVLISSALTLSAGDSTDSLQKSLKKLQGNEKADVLLRLANLCIYTDAALSKAYTAEAFSIALKKGDKTLMARCMIQEGLRLNSTGSYDSALKVLDKASLIYDWSPESSDLARLYTVKGISSENIGSTDSALNYYQKAFDIYKLTGNHQGIANSYLNLGCLFLKLKKYDQADTHLQQALNESIKHSKTASLGSIYNNLGVVHDVKGRAEKAIECYSKALEIEEKVGNKSVMANIYNNMALIHNRKKEYREALEDLQRSVELKMETGNREGTANSYTVMAEVYSNLNDIGKAYHYVKKALEIAETGGFLYVEANCRKQLALIYESKAQYENASNEWKKAFSLNDSLYDQSVTQKISDLQSRYEMIQKEQENKILRQQISLQEIKSSRQKIYTRFLLLAVIASLLVLALLYYILRMKIIAMKNNKELFDKQSEIKSLELKNLNTSIELKNKELTSLSANFININDMLRNIRKSLSGLKKYFNNEIPAELNELLSLINSNLDNDLNWKKFRVSFEQTHAGFLDRLIKVVPDLTLNEQKLCAYLYIGLSSNEIARIMNISLAAVNKNRQRLRKTLSLQPNADICEFLKNIDIQEQIIA